MNVWEIEPKCQTNFKSYITGGNSLKQFLMQVYLQFFFEGGRNSRKVFLNNSWKTEKRLKTCQQFGYLAYGRAIGEEK